MLFLYCRETSGTRRRRAGGDGDNQTAANTL
jgi:hypothetical protein